MAENISLAEGISEQASPKMYEPLFFREKQTQFAKEQRKQSDDDKFFSDTRKALSVPKDQYHRLIIPEVQKSFSDTWKRVSNAYQQDPNNYKMDATEAIQDFQNKLLAYKGVSKNLFDQEAKPAAELSDEGRAAQALMSTSKNYDDYVAKVKPIAQQSMGYVNVGDNGITIQPIPKDLDVTTKVKEGFRGLAESSLAQLQPGQKIGDTQLYNIIQTAPPDQKQEFLTNFFSTHHDALEAYRYNNRDKILKGQLADDPQALLKAAVGDYMNTPAQKILPHLERDRVEPQSEKKKDFKWDGTSYANDHNKWTPINSEQLPKAYTDVFSPETKKYLKGAVSWNVSHPDAAGRENNPLSYSDKDGKPVIGRPETVIYNPKTDEGIVIISTVRPGVEQSTSPDGKKVIPAVPEKIIYTPVPLDKNRGKIAGENGADPKQVYEAMKSGKDLFGQKVSSKSSGSSSSETVATEKPQKGSKKYSFASTQDAVKQKYEEGDLIVIGDKQYNFKNGKIIRIK